MTVSTTTNKVSYVGNGITTEFAIPFPFLETTHLSVYQLLNDIQTEREDWTVQNGNLIFETAPANEAQIVIMRIVPFTQETDYQENEILAAGTLERNFDSLTMQVQQLKELSERTVTVDIFDDTPAAELLPSIRSAVSDAAGYAQTATEQAAIATNKAEEATETLENKADTTLDNIDAEGRSLISKLSMPGSLMVSGIFNSPATTEAQTFVAPANGWVYASCEKSAGATEFYRNGIVTAYGGCSAENIYSYFGVNIPCNKNDVISYKTTSGSGIIWASTFFYAQGEI